MQGSGIKEALSLTYAPNSLDKMLTGHAYARAHTLLHLTLATIISKEFVIDDDMDANLQKKIEDVKNNTISYNDIENYDEKTEALLYQCNKKLNQYEGRGSTGKLWIQYFHMISIAKEFIRAKRMGDWQAHLNCVKEMIPYFHASGHFPYAQSAHLYLQDMLQKENLIDPSVFRRFIQGFLTVRRSAKFSCGTSTDMIIEQSLMKSMQTDGVFDGYSDYTKNIKVAEQCRRTTKISSSSDVLFDRFMTVPTNQQQFLANIHNKSRFISMLSEKLKAADIFVKQANNDADVLIIETALEKFNTNTTIVVGEYVDLLIILTARTPTDRIIYFLKPGKAEIETKMYSSQNLTSYPKCQAHISFLHAITGCDTTSACFKRGKTKVFKLFEKRHDLIDCAEVFANIGSSPDIILTNETRFLLAMHGAPKKLISKTRIDI
ncbi:hypothetical protein AVEN_207736-1 [Araneus ventricosus]|uniref:Uncharacterized protein n=1 Tax=Araneus ventricosus TaxID=182803 RepID=A0A4Y2WB41_ARAVE|nr:hypothetical protein AVEN_207736-1 [Araneus ventricosus]